MQGIDLGDERLNKRVVKVLDELGGQPTASIPTACGGWHETKAAYRFFDNSRVTAKKVLSPHRAATLKRIREHHQVLLLQDTTELDYSSQKEKEDVGPSHAELTRALFLHPLLAVTPSKLCLGVVDVQSWYRKELHRKRHTRKETKNLNLHHRSIQEKESYCWLKGYRSAVEVAKACPGTRVIMVADRGADVFDVYDEAEQLEGVKAEWLVRAMKNRALLSEEGKRDKLLLKEKLLQTPPIGKIQFILPRRNLRASRHVIQSVRVLRIKLHPPTGRRGKLRLRPAWVTAILAKEENPPAGVEAIEWLLLTSVSLDKTTSAYDVIFWYICRWQVEIFFRVLKRGCHIEELQLTKAKRFMPCLMVYMIVAWRILFLSRLSRHVPDIPCTEIFEEEEWQCAYVLVKKNALPSVPPTLSAMVKMVASLGGFLGRTGDGDPGPKSLWLGLQRLREAVNFMALKEKILSLKNYG